MAAGVGRWKPEPVRVLAGSNNQPLPAAVAIRKLGTALAVSSTVEGLVVVGIEVVGPWLSLIASFFDRTGT